MVRHEKVHRSLPRASRGGRGRPAEARFRGNDDMRCVPEGLPTHPAGEKKRVGSSCAPHRYLIVCLESSLTIIPVGRPNVKKKKLKI